MNGFGLFSNLVERVQSTIDANLGIDSEQAKEAMGEFRNSFHPFIHEARTIAPTVFAHASNISVSQTEGPRTAQSRYNTR